MMNANPLKTLGTFGQSIWLDYIRRDLITSGQLRRLIEEDGLRGMTSNPSIFEKAIVGSHEYDQDIRTMASEGKGVNAIYETLSQRDVQSAADEFRSVYDKTDGHDGYVSLEVNPHLARDTKGTVAEAHRLWKMLARPNVFIKVPATTEGLSAIQELISEGINVNVTLLFGLPRYRQVADAYLAGLAARAARGKPVNHVASVASFFVSRIDGLVDPLLEKVIGQGGDKADLAKTVRGHVAIASAKMAYQLYKEMFGSDRFKTIGRPGSSCPAPPLGQHQHQEPGRERREIRGGTHRTGHGQHGAPRNPRRLPRPWGSETPPRTGCRGSSIGNGAITETGNQHRPGDTATRGRRSHEVQQALRQAVADLGEHVAAQVRREP